MITWSDKAWGHYCHWQETDKKIVKHINVLIKELQRHPFTGIGEPEPLRHDLSGYWSRRITQEHRLVYKLLEDDNVLIASCRFHYQS
jgi:toxin YoeB